MGRLKDFFSLSVGISELLILHPLSCRYTLFVYNIGFQATDRTLWQLISPFGTVQKVNVMLDHEKNQCKGYGFVTMTNYQEAQNAINCLNGHFYQGRVLQVRFFAIKIFFVTSQVVE